MKKKQKTTIPPGEATILGPLNQPITYFWGSLNWIEIINEEKLDL